MGRSAAPELTVRYSGSAHTFVAGNDVVIGRDIHADLRIPDPLISRAHLVLRFDEGRWVAIDNDSLNGMFVHGRRVPAVDVEDGQNINIGSLVGPLLTFEVDGNSVGGPRSSEVSSAPRAGQRTTHRCRPGTAPQQRGEVEYRDQHPQDPLVGQVRRRGAVGLAHHRPRQPTTTS